MQKVYLFMLGLLVLTACQGGARPVSPDTTDWRMAEAALKALPASGLGPQRLAPGECGLFLWSQTDISKFTFFSKALSGTALIAQGDTAVSLQQIKAGGDIFGQFNTDLQFETQRGDQIVNLILTPGELLEGGQRIKSGLLTTTGAQGWQTKLPVLGVRACQDIK